MKLKKIVSILLSVSMMSGFAMTAHASKMVIDGSTISTWPDTESILARDITVQTTVAPVTKDEWTGDFYDAEENELDIYAAGCKVFKLTSTVKPGTLACQSANKYVGLQAIELTYDVSSMEQYIFEDGIEQIGIVKGSGTAGGTFKVGKSNVAGQEGQLKVIWTTPGTDAEGLYPAFETGVVDPTITLVTYMVLSSDAPNTITIPSMKANSKITYYARKLSNYFDSPIERSPLTMMEDELVLSSGPVLEPATSLDITKATTTLDVDGTETLAYTVEPTTTTDTVVWSSSDDSIVTVDQTGKITAVAAGKATITATAGSVSDTCVVSVNGINVGSTKERFYAGNGGYVWNVDVVGQAGKTLECTFTDKAGATDVNTLFLGKLEGLANFNFNVILKTTHEDVTMSIVAK